MSSVLLPPQARRRPSWRPSRAELRRWLSWRPTLRIQLLSLAAIVLLPMLALQLRQTLGDVSQAREQARIRVQDQADQLAGQMAATLQRTRLMLEFLATRSELAHLDPQACSQLLESMVTVDPVWANLGLIGADGQGICASLRPQPIVQLNFRDRPWLQDGLAAGGFKVHEARWGRMLGRMVIVTTLPHRDRQGRVDALLLATLDADALARQWTAARLPVGSLVELANGAGTQLSHRIGTFAADTESLSARASIAGSDLGLAVTQPLAPLLAGPWAALRDDLTGLLLCGLLAVALALVLSRRISTPLRGLAAAAAAVARGERGVRAPAMSGELATLAAQFNRMQTVREQDEEALRRSLQRFELAAASGNVWYWDIEQGGGFSLGAARSLLGHSLAHTDMSLTDWQALVLDEDRPLLREALVAHLRDRKPYHVEVRACAANGGIRVLQLRGQAVWAPSGRAVRMAGTVFDVTERHQVQEAQAQRAIAEAASAAKSGFVARMSHELRTPLNAVLGFAQLLEHDDKEPLSPLQRRRLQHISDGGRHLLALMDDMLDTARVELGQLKVVLQAVELEPLLYEVLGLQQAAAARHGVLLGACPPCASLRVSADPLRLRQVLLNLLSNAIKYNRSGGAVRVAVWQEGGRLCLSVEDQGPGFSPAQLAQVFQPYNRLGREGSAVQGVGLGLALSRQLLHLMGGEIEIGNAPAGGCRALLSLPLA